jgi:DNA polymerase bacteriophage-type
MIDKQESILRLDFETQSRVNITNPTYTTDQSTKILCMAYGIDDGEGYLWWPGDELPQWVVDHIDAGGLVEASNARFDREIWQYVGEVDHNFPRTEDDQWICSQAQARVAGLPSALDKSARALGIKQRKDTSGSRLISACCIPPYSTDPQDYADLASYCLQDYVVMRDVALAIPRLNDFQIEDYQLNERINDRGIKVDVELAKAAMTYAEAERAEINEKLVGITAGEITSHTQHRRVCQFLRDHLQDMPDVLKLMRKHVTDKSTGEDKVKWSSDKGVRANLTAGDEDGAFALPVIVKDLLECMEDAGGSAVSKFTRMVQKADPLDDRVRGILRYSGAPSTLRYSSMGLQIHNFRRDAFSLEDAEFIRDLLLKGEEITDRKGNRLSVMDTLGRLLRSAIIPKDGHVLVVGDWNAVESRMTAWLAGDRSKIDMFLRGEDPYCYEASAIYGREITPADAKERSIGKVTDLACGFMGGPGALAAMAAQFRIFIDPDQMQDIVDKYRSNHQAIVEYSDQLMGAAIRAVMDPGVIQKVKHTAYLFNPNDRALYCQLTGGINMIRYPEARVEMVPVPWSDTETRPQLTALKAAFTPAADAKEWARHGLWRGIFIENIAQGNCAQLLREKLIDCEDAGLPAIFHVHDEIVLEVPEEDAEAARLKLKEIMERTPHWLEGLPLVADPEIMYRYGK